VTTPSAPDPVFLATAVEIVLRAGEIQMAGRESGFHVAKKGEIDLVTEVDLACERMCRAVLAERFPEHDILAEELSAGPQEAARARYRWVFDPLDGTTNSRTACPSSARRSRWSSTAPPTTRTACPSSARRSRWSSTASRSSAPSTTRRAASSSPRSAGRARS
jgi:hypothetical protein